MSRLRVENLTVRLGGKTIVDRASFAVEGPAVIAIVGPNGSGKTTLLRALLGLVRSEGVVAWAGDTALVGYPDKLARQTAYLAQAPSSLAGQTVSQAILAGRFSRRGAFDFLDSADDATAVKAIANELQLTDLLDRPLDTLSGGQRQRVFLGRCLAQATPTLILDEPATFLDLRHQLDLYGRLRRLSREHGKTILLASHDLNLAATYADRMLVMDAGRIIADGPPAEVLTPTLLHQIYGVEMKRIEVDGDPHFIVARVKSGIPIIR